MSIFSGLFFDENKKIIKAIQPQVEAVFSLEEELKSISDHELKHRSLL